MLPSSPPKDKKDTPLDWLKQAFFYGIQSVNGKHCVIQHLKANSPWPANRPIYVIAIGKAAQSMAEGAIAFYSERICKGLVITAPAYRHSNTLPSTFSCIESSHPIPNKKSLAAGAALLAFIRKIPADSQVLLLISGGSSAMVEQLPPRLDLDTLQKINVWLLQSGLDIHRINALRKNLSEIKGGRLAKALAQCHTHCLMISDVVGDQPEHIASGLVHSSTPEPHPKNLPKKLRDALLYATPPPNKNDACFDRIKTHIIANNRQARQAIATFAQQSNIPCTLHPQLITEDILNTAQMIAETLKNSPVGLHIWGGEPTVKLPPNPGRGGRNQALALTVAQRIAGEKDTYFLSAGTDGIDGNSLAAGAIINGDTLQQAAKKGIAAAEYLKTANSSIFFEKTTGRIECNPTGTNVMDLMLGLKRY